MNWELHDPRRFWAIAGGLFAVQFLLGALALPPWVSILSAILFIAAPIAALFCAASADWKAKTGFIWLAAGVAVQVACVIALRGMPKAGLPTVLVECLAQTGLLVWCTGLGSLVGLLIKDKNLILPVAIFLAGFDIFLVMTPNTFVAQTVANNPALFQSVAMRVPMARAEPKPEAPQEQRGPRIQALAYIGPADLIFVTTFFALLFRFQMQIRKTVAWLIPVLILYMGVALMGMPLPALVPIGLTVLLVNIREFKFARDEKIGLALVSVLAVGLAAYGIYRRATYVPPPKKPAAPAPSAVAPGPPGSEATPAPALPGPRQ